MMTLNLIVIVLSLVVVWLWIFQLAADREEDRHWQEWAERLDDAEHDDDGCSPLADEQRDHLKTTGG